jgi:hypothetical protein
VTISNKIVMPRTISLKESQESGKGRLYDMNGKLGMLKHKVKRAPATLLKLNEPAPISATHVQIVKNTEKDKAKKNKNARKFKGEIME